MSYVGIMTSDCGAVAFSDSRSTSVLWNDQHQLNDNTKKVFASKRFVLATAGVNEILIGPDKKIRLDEVLDDALDGFGKSHREFF